MLRPYFKLISVRILLFLVDIYYVDESLVSMRKYTVVALWSYEIISKSEKLDRFRYNYEQDSMYHYTKTNDK